MPEAPRPNNPLAISPLKAWRESPRQLESASPRFGNPHESAGRAFGITGGMSPEDAEAEMNALFFSSWAPRIDRMMEDDGLAAHVQRSLLVGVAEGDPAIMAAR